jgi:hypothetical protein
MSRFNSAQIKDMSGASVEQEHWLSNYVLNSLFRLNLDEPLRQTLFNFLRWTQFAFREYALAREQTMAYLRGVDAVPTYFLAIGHWETFLAYACQGYEIFREGGEDPLHHGRRLDPPAPQLALQPVQAHRLGDLRQPDRPGFDPRSLARQ